jgi:hypothetical protein
VSERVSEWAVCFEPLVMMEFRVGGELEAREAMVGMFSDGRDLVFWVSLIDPMFQPDGDV